MNRSGFKTISRLNILPTLLNDSFNMVCFGTITEACKFRDNVLEETPILAHSVFPTNIKAAILYNTKYLCTDNLSLSVSLSSAKRLNPRLNNPSDTLQEQFCCCCFLGGGGVSTFFFKLPVKSFDLCSQLRRSKLFML